MQSRLSINPILGKSDTKNVSGNSKIYKDLYGISEIDFTEIPDQLSLNSILSIRNTGNTEYIQANSDEKISLYDSLGQVYLKDLDSFELRSFQAYSIGPGLFPTEVGGVWEPAQAQGRAVLFFSCPKNEWVEPTIVPKRIYSDIDSFYILSDLYSNGFSIFWAATPKENHYEFAKTKLAEVYAREDVSSIICYGIRQGAELAVRLALDSTIPTRPIGGIGDRGRYYYPAMDENSSGALFGEETLATVSQQDKEDSSALQLVLDDPAGTTDTKLLLAAEGFSPYSTTGPPFPQNLIPAEDFAWHAKALADLDENYEFFGGNYNVTALSNKISSWALSII